MLRNSMITALLTFFMASTSAASVLSLGSTNGDVNGFPTVESASAQGRHSSYTVYDFAKGELQYNSLRIIDAQILVDSPEDFGGDVDRAVELLGQAQAAALRLKTAITAPIFLMTGAFNKAKSKYPQLNTSGEMDSIISELERHSGANLKELTMFVERSSATMFFEVTSSNGTTTGEISLSENFFQTLIGLWASTGRNNGSINIIFK